MISSLQSAGVLLTLTWPWQYTRLHFVHISYTPLSAAVGAGRRYYGLLAQRFCYLKREYQEVFEDCFRRQYNLIHRLETNKLRNVAKVSSSAELYASRSIVSLATPADDRLHSRARVSHIHEVPALFPQFFGHQLTTDAISWGTLSNIVLTEEATTSSARIFIKILFQVQVVQCPASQYGNLQRLRRALWLLTGLSSGSSQLLTAQRTVPAVLTVRCVPPRRSCRRAWA